MTHKPHPWTYQHPLLYITTPFIAGIITAHHTPNTTYIPHITLAILTLTYTTLTILSYLCKKNIPNITILAIISIFSAGYLSLHITQPTLNPHHLIHHTQPIQAYQAIVTSHPITKNNGTHTTITLQKARIKGTWHPTIGKIRLTYKQNTPLHPQHGDTLLILGNPQKPKPPTSLNTFDYKKYLANQNIHHIHLTHASNITKLSSLPKHHPLNLALKTKLWMAKQLKNNIKDPTTIALVLALTLGMREKIKKELQQTYITTGVIHILAISGLHIGLLHLLLLLLLRLLKLHKGIIGKTITLITLWTYAYITGLTPSILRAVTISSLLTLTNLLKRPHQNINTLALSALLLTHYNPHLLLQISFQLSYAAIIGILYLQPKLNQYIRLPKTLKKITQPLTISLSAQLTTLPITLYHFHTLPTYALLANLIAIPATSLILSLAILIPLTAKLPCLPLILAKATIYTTNLLHLLLQYLQQLPGSHITNLKPSLTTTILLYTIPITLWLALHHRQLIYLLASTLLSLLLLIQHLNHSTPPHHITFTTTKPPNPHSTLSTSTATPPRSLQKSIPPPHSPCFPYRLPCILF